MIKVKDGYAKLVGTTASGSASHILLSNGGVKAVSDFAKASALDNYLPLSGGTMNGVITMPINYQIQWGSSSMMIYGEDTNAIKIVAPLGLYVNSKEVWHSGNDGSGSGLDADLLDGYHVTHFMSYIKGSGYVQANLLNSELWNVAGGNGYIEYYDNGTWFNSRWGRVLAHYGFDGDLRGNASSATKLQTARTIWGQSFDGSGDISGSIDNCNWIRYYKGGSVSGYIVGRGEEITGGDGLGLWTYGNTPIFLGTGSKQRMTIDSSGNVGIGTTSPSSKLHVLGDITASGILSTVGLFANDGTIILKNSANGSGLLVYPGIDESTAARFEIRTNNAWARTGFTLFTNGNFTIGTSNDQGYRFFVAGDTKVQGNILATGSLSINSYADFYNLTTHHEGLRVIGRERSNIYTVYHDNSVITTNSPHASASIRTALAFQWYNTTWQIGNVRGQSSDSAGFGVTYGNDNLCFRVTTSDCFVGSNKIIHEGNYKDYVANMYWANVPVSSTSNDKTTPTFANTTVNGIVTVNGPQNALTINSSGKSAYTLFIKMINPNMSTYHTSLLAFGYDQTAYNVGYIGFKFVAKDSKSNMVTLGLHSVDHVLNITGNGFVGIGTEAPTASLSVNGHVHIGNSSYTLSSPWKSGIVVGPDGTDKIVATYLASSTNGATVGAHNSALSAWAPLHLVGTKIHFRVNESLKMELTTSGQLAILKTGASTNSGLVVGADSTKSNISTSIADQTAMIQIVAGSGGNTNSTAIGFHNPGISSAVLEYRNTNADTGYFKFRSDDSTWGVGINNTGNPRGLLDVNGDIYTNPYIRFVDSQRYCGYFSGGKYLELQNGVGGVGIHLYDNGNAYVYKSGSKYTIIDSGNYSSYALPFYTKTSGDCNSMSLGLTVFTAVASNQNGGNHSAFLTITSIGTPFQLQIPDSSEAYIYKRCKSGSSWSAWSKLSAGYADSAGSVAWGNVTGKPGSFTPASHTHTYIESKANYTFTSSTLPNSFDWGVSAGFVADTSGFGSYGSVLTVRTYSGGGGTLQLYAPYSNTYGGSRLKARFGNYDSNTGNSWTSLKELAWLGDIPSVGNGTVTITLNGTTKGTFTMNQSGNTTIALTDTLPTSTFSSLFINTGDPTLKIYSGRVTDAKSDGNICLQTCIDGLDGQTHSHAPNHPGRENLVLLPRGGQVYIGTNPDGGNTSYKLWVNGNTYASGSLYAAHFYENSDAKLKENIQAILDRDNMPQIKEFDWKESGEHSYGLIAQELEEQGYSELVSTKDDGYKTVNYSAALSLIVGKLLVKIQEIEKENKELRDEINNLKTNKLWQS